MRRSTCGIVLLALALCGAQRALSAPVYDTIVDPISGRKGHVPKPEQQKLSRRLAGATPLAVDCGAFNACPLASTIAQALLGNNPNLTLSAGASFSKGLCAQWGTIPAGGFSAGHVMAGWFPKGAVVLSSGIAATGNCNSNTLDYYTGLIGGGGDANLDALVPAYTTYDAVALEFEVTAERDGMLVFQYAFGSDEYTEWVNTAFNDVFGFFIAPIGTPITSGHNVAIVKGTADTQVSINNVNGGSHSDIWTNNRAYDLQAMTPPQSTVAIEADGFTSLLNTQGYPVVAGQRYRFKLAIADAGDQILDSWVYISAGSLLLDQKPNANGTVVLPTPTPGCPNPIVALDASKSTDSDAGDSLTYAWTVSAALPVGGCVHTVTAAGASATVNMSNLASGVTYTVTLTVYDKFDVDDIETETLHVPSDCGVADQAAICANAGTGSGGGTGGGSGGGEIVTYFPPPNLPPWPPGISNNVVPSFPPSSYIMAGLEVAVVPCDGDVTITIDGTTVGQEGLQQTIGDTSEDEVIFIWRVSQFNDQENPVMPDKVIKYTNPDGSYTTSVTFTAAELGQSTAVQTLQAWLDVTDVGSTWDQGAGIVDPTPTFVKLLGCPITPATPHVTIAFDDVASPKPFTVACGATVDLDGTIPATGKTVTLWMWTLEDAATGALIKQFMKTTAVFTNFDLSIVPGVTLDTFYSLSLRLFGPSADWDNDNWSTKVSMTPHRHRLLLRPLHHLR
ncbi:hypothetical protein HYH03_005185 [Edaphochlamys debaryana]|uniref:PKD domain-containing protein n=1 Tax=Edaphochlamys debaryana TaxID=47281 RepID=A0A835Y861_9CHLO|nr:hypothetical protein HYH03_005185 [Edaphochlamys debaryana]|eukprot:KAG2496777.1 hypothetical protein HYH03_005185 [Edaphochlamys debaryana]